MQQKLPKDRLYWRIRTKKIIFIAKALEFDDFSVGVVTRLRAGRPRNRCSIHAGILILKLCMQRILGG
jgi:hypothetical protein